MVDMPGNQLDSWELPDEGEYRLSGIVVSQQGCSAWGGLRSDDGSYFVVLQSAWGTMVPVRYIQQTVDVEPGRTHTLRFLVAERPGHDDNERVTVFVDDTVVIDAFNPEPRFTAKTVSFVGPSSGKGGSS